MRAAVYPTAARTVLRRCIAGPGLGRGSRMNSRENLGSLQRACAAAPRLMLALHPDDLAPALGQWRTRLQFGDHRLHLRVLLQPVFP